MSSKQTTAICNARVMHKFVEGLPSRYPNDGVISGKLYTSWSVTGTDIAIAVAIGRNIAGHIVVREVITVVPWQVKAGITSTPEEISEEEKIAAAAIQKEEQVAEKIAADKALRYSASGPRGRKSIGVEHVEAALAAASNEG